MKDKKAPNKYWIQGATSPENKGSYRSSVSRRFGSAGFTTQGTIKQSVINKDIHSSNPRLRGKAQFAKNLHSIGKKRRKK